MKFKKQPMVNWYDVGQLASTGIKTIISSIFGNFSDKREFQAAYAPDETFHDFSQTDGNDTDGFWLDYISDLGDGFDATYTMAHLMAQPNLTVDGHETSRGNILIMGGDEVYPTPEKEEYDNRFKGPYFAAFPWDDKVSTRLFAIPGNHDWYDGLTNFTRIFFQKRSIGNWHTKQQRSYFAIKLPKNYWVIGIDVQLNADIDAPQKEFFQKIAKNDIQAGDKIILCTAEPTWIYESWSHKEKSNDRIQYFVNKILYGEDEDHYDKDNKAQLVAVLTGDLHHYSRYEETDKETTNSHQLITAGGGGAFMSPTHFLRDEMNVENGKKRKLKSEPFPSKKQSATLGLLNLVFPFYTFSMWAFLGFFHLVTTWFLQSNPTKGGTFMDQVVDINSLGELFLLVINSIKHNPSAMLLNLLLVGGIIAFTDTKTGKGKWNYIAGVIHGALHFINFYVLIWLFSGINEMILPGVSIDSMKKILLFSGEMVLVGGFISAFIFGLYLLVSTLIVRNHPTEAFSSFRWSGYKNFLRIHIDKDGVAKIYPIGVQKVVKNWKNIGTEEIPKFEGDRINAQLIEEPFELNKKL